MPAADSGHFCCKMQTKHAYFDLLAEAVAGANVP